jgi:copper(I)-binding protein
MKLPVLIVLLVLTAVACDPTPLPPLPPLTANNVEIRTPVPGMPMSVAYMTLSNNSNSDILIARISSPQFAAVELHETRVTDGVSSMHRIDEIEIAAGATLQLQRGGKHLMLMRRDGQPDEVTLNLHADGLLILSLTAPLLEGTSP